MHLTASVLQPRKPNASGGLMHLTAFVLRPGKPNALGGRMHLTSSVLWPGKTQCLGRSDASHSLCPVAWKNPTPREV